MTADLLWPRYASPEDLAAIEALPLAERGLPATTYEIVVGTVVAAQLMSTVATL